MCVWVRERLRDNLQRQFTLVRRIAAISSFGGEIRSQFFSGKNRGKVEKEITPEDRLSIRGRGEGNN